MIVGRDIRIKMIHAVPHVQTPDLAVLRQEGQIAVYSAQTDIRIFLPDTPVDCVCCGVVLPAYEEILDQLSLPAVFPCSHPALLPEIMSKKCHPVL